MIIDINTYIGHYPFRSVDRSTPSELVALMDEFGISKACVSSISGVFYRDVARGNYELLKDIKPYNDRFVPFCNINPKYTYVCEDLIECNRLGFKGVKLFPATHDYKLDSPESVKVLKLAAELKMPVQLPVYIEDYRQRHPMDFLKPITPENVKQAAIASPDTDFIISNIHSHNFAAALSAVERKGQVYYDIGRVDNLNQISFKSLLSYAGVEHIVIGTGAPLQYIGVQLIKLAFMEATDDLTEEEIALISYGNAKRLLNI